MAATLTKFRGGLALLGSVIDEAASKFRVSRDATPTTMPHHITLLTKQEYRSMVGILSPDDEETIPSVSVDQLYFLGVGGAEFHKVYWIVCVWVAGAAFRKNVGLPPADFHITLTGNDVHNVGKNALSLLHPESLALAFPEFATEKQDHVLHHLHSVGSQLTLPLSISSAIAHPENAKAFLRLGDASSVENPKLAMLAYAHALLLDGGSSMVSYVAKRMRRLTPLTHFGPVVTVSERDSMSEEIREILVVGNSWCVEAREIGHDLLDHPPTMVAANTRERLWFAGYELPRFFSWIVPYFLAGMSTPRKAEDVDALAKLGITRILTLTKEEPLPASWFAFKTVKNVFIPVANYEAPTFKEVDYFLEAVQEEDTVWLVHCGGGKGRAGTFLACYIALYGFQKPTGVQRHPICDAGTVIRWLRAIRPGSIETTQQEQFVSNWISYRWKSKAEEVAEPTAPMSIDGRVPENPALIILVGLPGSGKSSFSSALQKRKPAVDVVSQDESGSRSSCENAISRRRNGTTVILDRCNPSQSERREWLALADVGESNAVAVYFDVDNSICTQRIDRRIHHPTLRAGRSTNAMNQMKRLMSKPSLQEGFSAVITIPSFEGARQAVKLLTGTPPLVKFPRTQHLINLGAATADDIVSTSFQCTGPVVIEEKIDGANMGISLDDTGSLVVQNRSHTVNSRSHAQFRRLDAWLERHARDLHSILLRDEEFPERHILYGEWVVATHSIPYSALPDVFLAFDFYDRVTDSFASRALLARLLDGTGIQQVPLICDLENGVSRDQILPLVTSKSAFYDGPVEGVYVRFEDRERTRTVERGKVVRADFVAGNEHWSKGIVKSNGILDSSHT